jgi:hypothetical protein
MTSIRCAAFVALSFVGTLSTQVSAMQDAPPAPSGRFDNPLKGYDFALDISEEESKAQLNVGGYILPPPKLKKSDDDNVTKLPVIARNDLTWKAGIELPLGGADNVLDDATLDALGDGPKLSGSVNILSYRFDPNILSSEKFDSLMERARSACVQQAKGNEADLRYCRQADKAENFILTYLPSARLELNRIAFAGYSSYSVRASLGANRFKYVTPLTLDKNRQTKASYSFAGTAVYYPSDAVSAWKIEAEYANAYDAEDETILCKAIVVDSNKDCVQASGAAPAKKETLVLRGEYRRFFPFANGKGGIGMALTSSLDTLSDDVGFELPVYWSLPGEMPVAPGIKFGYTTEKKDFTVSLFLKTAFKF